MQRLICLIVLTFIAALNASTISVSAAVTERPPNIVYVMSDELAYYELSHMGNAYIRTPNIDQMATEGMRFTQALAAAPVCAPLRCSLMTGKHMGHASVRANDGGTPLRADELTIASILKQRGYATGGFGKWGAGGRDSTGVPESHGFDQFFGYYDQVHAHSFYPPYLIRNSQEVPLEGNRGGRSGQTYSHYEIMKEALKFIRANKEKPFFCYLPITPPHGMYDIPADDPAWEQYRDAGWMSDSDVPQDVKNYAAMVTMVDHNLGEVISLLDELALSDNTIVFFTGDNGGQDRFRSPQHPRGFFGPNVDPRTGVEFRGGKGNLFEGGLRIPYLVRWPGKIKAGQVSDLLCYQPDVLPTLAELTGARVPDDIDGLSFLTELLGEKSTGRKQINHEFLYWEFGPQVAVRMKNWKAIRAKRNGPWQLYDLSQDISESVNVAEQHPDILDRLKLFASQSHEPVRSGSYRDRTLHEQDRRAKWGGNGPLQSKRSRVQRIRKSDRVPADQMKVVSVSSERKAVGRDAVSAIDDKPRTHWHTRFSDRPDEHPHTLVIDLGNEFEIRHFYYLARQDESWNGTFGRTRFFVGQGLEEFGDPVAEATFKKVRTVQSVACPTSVRGRYVKIQVLSEVNGNAWASAAEIAIGGVRAE